MMSTQVEEVPSHARRETRGSRRQMRHVELQGVDATRIVNSLSARGARGWPVSGRTR